MQTGAIADAAADFSIVRVGAEAEPWASGFRKERYALAVIGKSFDEVGPATWALSFASTAMPVP